MQIRLFVLVVLGSIGPLAVATAEDRPFTFRDVTAETGISPLLPGAISQKAIWADVDNDGQLDLWLTTSAGGKPGSGQTGTTVGSVLHKILTQRQGRFLPSDHGAFAWNGHPTSCVMADFDNDGWTDLFVSNTVGTGKGERLFRNNQGTLELVEEPTSAPPRLPETSRGVGVLDFDGNGFLDLLVLAAPGKGPSLLLQNQGNFRFKLSSALPADLTGLGVAVGDIDNNGLPDLFVGGSNRLFVNQGRGRFREAKELGLQQDFVAEDDALSCGVAFGDFDRDGRMDLLIGSHTATPWSKPIPLRLLRNLGSTPEKAQFADVTAAAGLGPLPMRTPHVEIRDFDNDGWPDLYTSVVIFKNGQTYPAIYKNMGAKAGELPRFQETAFVHRPEFPEQDDYHPKMTSSEFFDGLSANRKLTYFCSGPSSDFDGDGRLDLLLANGNPPRPALLLKNETKGGTFVDVTVVGGDKMNRDGIGSLVRAYAAGEAMVAGGKGFIASEPIATGYGFASGQAPVAHLGLGDSKTCDIVVTLPHGQGQIVRRGVPTNSRLRIDASSAAVKESSASVPWPPRLAGAKDGTVTVKTDRFLEVPPQVADARSAEGIAPFVMAKTPPTVDLAFQGNLGSEPANRRLWSSWGDICLASDGAVYVGIGDHGHDAEGDGRCFIYRWDPTKKTLTQVVDMNQVVPPQPGQPAWTKVHAKIDEGLDGKIYFCCTLNAGNAAGDPKYHWTEQLPGAQLYQYDPQTGRTTTFANLPPKRCTATSLFDKQRNIWWCNLEAGEGDALYGLDLATKNVVYQSRDGAVGFNRNFALAADGTIYFNGAEGAIMHLDPLKKLITPTGTVMPGAPGMRASTRQTETGDVIRATYKSSQLFRYRPSPGDIELLGPTWGTGEYTAVMLLSPDQRFVYYLPGSHGQAFRYGTPLIQYEIATKTRKVLAFLGPALEEQIDYVPGGTYGIALSKDGGTLYVNFNGHAADEIRPGKMTPIGFGLCSFAAIHIPSSER